MTTSCARGSRARCSIRSTRWSGTTSSTTPGTKSSPGVWRRPTSWRSSRSSAASGSSPCGRRSSSASGASAASSTTTPTPPSSRVSGPCWHRWSRISAIRSMARTTCAARSAACSSGRWRSRVTTKRPSSAPPALYEQQEADPGSVDPELVAAATSIVAFGGDEAVYERMLDGYRTAATPQDQLRHLYALAEFDAEPLVMRTCELAMSGEVKTQNAPFLLRSCIASRRHGSAAWTFVRRHWDEANAAFPNNSIVRMVDSVKTADRRAGRRGCAGVLRRAPDRAVAEDARSDPRAPARQHGPAGSRAGALRHGALTPGLVVSSEIGPIGPIRKDRSGPVELRGIEPLASTVRLLRSTN